MAYSAISAFLPQIANLPDRDLLTFVLAGGCNLNCSWCAVSARGERLEFPILDDRHYRRFVDDLASKHLISGIAIVGDEPLLPTAWRPAKEILRAADQNGLPSAVITNGTHLRGRAHELAAFDCQIILSLDGIGRDHDNTRRTPGAYKEIVHGLELSQRHFPELIAKMTVSSVVQPEKYGQLEGIPRIVSRFGIRNWALSPLIQFRRNHPARLHPRLFPDLYTKLPRIIKRGTDIGLRVMIDDGLGLLPVPEANSILLGAPIKRPESKEIRVIRMGPDGKTVRHGDLLQDGSSIGIWWNGTECPSAFYKRLYDATESDEDFTASTTKILEHRDA